MSINLPPYGLTGYIDNNFTEILIDRKLVREYFFFFNGVVVLCNSKKQKKFSTFTTKAEYITLRYAAREIVWIQRFINKINLDIIEDLTLYGDNKININLTNNA